MKGPISSWRNYKQLYLLQASKCISCERMFYPPPYLCPCGSRQFEQIALSGKGKLVTFTQINNATKLFEAMVPYCIGIVALQEGVQLLAQITDVALKDLYIGMPVQVVFRKFCEEGEAGIIRYGIKFIPDRGPASRQDSALRQDTASRQ